MDENISIKEDTSMNENTSTEENKSIEKLLDEIEEVIVKMENKDILLEESFRLYELGTKKLKEANELLDTYEKNVELLNANGDEDGSLKLVGE